MADHLLRVLIVADDLEVLKRLAPALRAVYNEERDHIRHASVTAAPVSAEVAALLIEGDMRMAGAVIAAGGTVESYCPEKIEPFVRAARARKQ